MVSFWADEFHLLVVVNTAFCKLWSFENWSPDHRRTRLRVWVVLLCPLTAPGKILGHVLPARVDVTFCSKGTSFCILIVVG